MTRSLPWIEPEDPFPPIDQALLDPAGLLCASRSLTPAMVVQAYQQGIFPWYSQGQPVLWWSPDPRMVLRVADFQISKSLGKVLTRRVLPGTDQPFEVRLNTAFNTVMRACAAPRDEHGGTWITPTMLRVYNQLHEQGIAFSVETWLNNHLVGGLYGMRIGQMVYGESMFTRMTDASKVALAHLVVLVKRSGGQWIDCQQQTAHLHSLGARPISRSQFAAGLVEWTQAPNSSWGSGVLQYAG